MKIPARCDMTIHPEQTGCGMQQVIRLLFFGFASMALGSGVAAAGNVVVPPILARGAPAQTASNMTTLVASELEFTGEFDEVNQLTKRPPQLAPTAWVPRPAWPASPNKAAQPRSWPEK